MSAKGSCNCGKIRFSTTHALGSVTGCHCGQCRKQTGHYAAAVPAPWGSISLDGEVTWYASSPGARRGFCGTCGCYLFWEEGDGLAYIMAGALDGETGLTMDGHIFYADKGDYYSVARVEPCYRAGSRQEEVAP